MNMIPSMYFHVFPNINFLPSILLEVWLLNFIKAVFILLKSFAFNWLSCIVGSNILPSFGTLYCFEDVLPFMLNNCEKDPFFAVRNFRCLIAGTIIDKCVCVCKLLLQIKKKKIRPEAFRFVVLEIFYGQH